MALVHVVSVLPFPKWKLLVPQPLGQATKFPGDVTDVDVDVGTIIVKWLVTWWEDTDVGN